jgi:hypothetical protein
LLAKTAIIESFNRCDEVGVRQKCLHDLDYIN